MSDMFVRILLNCIFGFDMSEKYLEYEEESILSQEPVAQMLTKVF